MFSIKTKEQILTDLLSRIGSIYDKSVGFIPYDLNSATAVEVETLYSNLSALKDLVDVEKMTGSTLDKYVLQRKGLIRKSSVKATGKIQVSGSGTVNIGDLFETAQGIQFEATQTVVIDNTGEVSIQAVVGGVFENVPSNTITLIPVTITGIVSVTNSNPTTGGVDAETDGELIIRYLEAVRTPATSGNKFHYISWAKSVAGVGDAKCISLWNGANTVKVVVIDGNKEPASQSLVNNVQDYIDPKGINNSTWGTGAGQAPIGCYATISSAIAKNLVISANVVKDGNFANQTIIDNVTAQIKAYLKSIAFKQDYVSYAKVGEALLNADGVIDYNSLLINGGATNIAVQNEEVAILQTLNLIIS